jgi:hypothetical protein
MATEYSDNAHNLVQNRFDDLKGYAETSFNKVSTYISNMSNLLETLEEPAVGAIEAVVPSTTSPSSYTFVNMGTFAPTIPVIKAPQAIKTDLENITLPDVADLDTAINTFETEATGAPGTFTAKTINKQTVKMPTAPATVAIGTVTQPTAPTITAPTVPTLTPITLPNKISLNLGSFNASSPGQLNIDSATPFYYDQKEYTSELASALISIVSGGMASAEGYAGMSIASDASLPEVIDQILKVGASGINEDIESRIYDRGKARLKTENESLYQQTINEFGASGFNLPTGVFAAKVSQVQKEISDKNDRLNYEIILNQTDLAQKNRQFMIEKAVQIEGLMIDLFNNSENRTLEAANAVAANGIEILRNQIDAHNAKLDVYKTEAAVFEIKMKSELNAIEMYKAEVQASAIETEVQKNQVDLYGKMVEAQKDIYEMYKVQMEGARLSMEIEQMKIQQLEMETRIYLAGIEAEKLKIDIYKEENEVEKVRLEAYLGELQAYQTKVETAAKKLEAEITVFNAKNESTKLLLDSYQIKAQVYQSELDYDDKMNERDFRNYQASIQKYLAEVESDKTENLLAIENAKNSIQEAMLQVEKIKAQLDLTVKSYVALKELQVTGTKGIMDVGAQLAASAMSAANASASYDFGSSQGATYSYQPYAKEQINRNYEYKM